MLMKKLLTLLFSFLWSGSMALAVDHITTGEQTGVDQAAWDAAIELKIRQNGWCPRVFHSHKAEKARLQTSGFFAPITTDFGCRLICAVHRRAPGKIHRLIPIFVAPSAS
jgi:hypothetical protein